MLLIKCMNTSKYLWSVAQLLHQERAPLLPLVQDWQKASGTHLTEEMRLIETTAQVAVEGVKRVTARSPLVMIWGCFMKRTIKVWLILAIVAANAAKNWM